MVNGSSPHAAALGSDESLGGALLTPIPWLKVDADRAANLSPPGGPTELKSESTEIVEGPNGVGRIETVTVVNGVMTTTVASPPTQSATSPPSASTEEMLRAEGAVTQGELLRQEQEAGVVPVSYASPRHALPIQGAAGELLPSEDDAEEHPHARGPEEIGMEDMGPQQPRPESSTGTGLDIEAAVGRKTSPEQTDSKDGEGEEPASTADAEASTKEAEEESKSTDEEMADVDTAAAAAVASAPGPEAIAPSTSEDEDWMVVDADGKTEDEAAKADADNTGPDAIDSTAQ